jgi:molybdopterin synthase sulfur carrier subunit
MTIKVLYFAWVREKVGRSEETLELPETVATVADMIAWLRARGPEYESAFARPEIIRTAINRTHVKSTAAVAGAREIAFFPPVTGG